MLFRSQAVVTGIETLSVALRAVTDEGERVVLEVVLELSQRPVAPLVDNFLRASEVKGLDSTHLCLQRVLFNTETTGNRPREFTWMAGAFEVAATAERARRE